MNTAWAVVLAVMAWIIYFMQFGVNAETRIAFKPNIALKQNMFYMNAMFGLNARWLHPKRTTLKQNRFKIELECPNLNLNVQTEHCPEV